ncbi:DsbA family protein [Halorussus halophilus]|uniref:DsbA family protein n=1 Tax=Halorussus halophilus TaxID=2650975 RepID=UPI0013017C71|nr:thioredoxin domain-containing protein [Halorussus halophilus]
MIRDEAPRTTRRRVLAVGGAAVVTGLAGCIGGGGSGDQSTTEGGTAMEGGTNTAGSLDGHASAVGLADQPRFGPPPSEATGVLVAFEDPSCPRCAAFERNTVPKIRENLSGEVSFVLRTYPVVYPWGKPATQAVEAAFAHEIEMADSGNSADSDAPGSRQGSVATWALADHYFAKQSSFNSDNVLDKTRQFLDSETDLDADAVVSDAESKTYDDAVQADLSAGEEAGVSGTPTIFLFRDGEFRTSANGSISYSVVKSALGL